MDRNEKLRQSIPTKRIPHRQSPAEALITPAVSTLRQTPEPHRSQTNDKRPLGKGSKSSNGQKLTDKPVIGWPQPLSEAPPFPTVGLSQAPGLAPPKIPNSPQIDARNLGLAREALCSHPIHVSTASSSPRNEKEQNRKYTIYENPDGRLVIRRAGRPTLFVSKAQSAALEEILSPESQPKVEEKKPVRTAKPATPSIHITQSSEENIRAKADVEHICENSAYKDLHKRSQRDNRVLRRQMKRLVPLAFLISDSEDIDVNDTAALLEKLEWIIEDSKMLVKVLPLASALCEDQRIDLTEDALRILPHVMRKVLTDARETQRARRAAGHYKRANQVLKSRLRTMEDELARWRFSGEEEYIYNPYSNTRA